MICAPTGCSRYTHGGSMCAISDPMEDPTALRSGWRTVRPHTALAAAGGSNARRISRHVDRQRARFCRSRLGADHFAEHLDRRLVLLDWVDDDSVRADLRRAISDLLLQLVVRRPYRVALCFNPGELVVVIRDISAAIEDGDCGRARGRPIHSRIDVGGLLPDAGAGRADGERRRKREPLDGVGCDHWLLLKCFGWLAPMRESGRLLCWSICKGEAAP